MSSTGAILNHDHDDRLPWLTYSINTLQKFISGKTIWYPMQQISFNRDTKTYTNCPMNLHKYNNLNFLYMGCFWDSNAAEYGLVPSPLTQDTILSMLAQLSDKELREKNPLFKLFYSEDDTAPATLLNNLFGME